MTSPSRHQVGEKAHRDDTEADHEHYRNPELTVFGEPPSSPSPFANAPQCSVRVHGGAGVQHEGIAIPFRRRVNCNSAKRGGAGCQPGPGPGGALWLALLAAVTLQTGFPFLVTDLVDGEFLELEDRLGRSHGTAGIIDQRNGLNYWDAAHSHNAHTALQLTKPRAGRHRYKARARNRAKGMPRTSREKRDGPRSSRRAAQWSFSTFCQSCLPAEFGFRAGSSLRRYSPPAFAQTAA